MNRRQQLLKEATLLFAKPKINVWFEDGVYSVDGKAISKREFDKLKITHDVRLITWIEQ